MLKPVYNEMIIVGIMQGNQFEWYVAHKHLFLLNLSKLSSEDLADYMEDETLKSVRTNLEVITPENAPLFLSRLEPFKVPFEALQSLLHDALAHGNKQVEEYYPALYINLDKKQLFSQFPEHLSFEEYLPSGWTGEFEDFTSLVPKNRHYWRR